MHNAFAFLASSTVFSNPNGVANRGRMHTHYAMHIRNSVNLLIRLLSDIIPRSNSLSSTAFPASSLSYPALPIPSPYTRPCPPVRGYPAASRAFKSWYARWSVWKSVKVSPTGWGISARRTRKDGIVDPMMKLMIETAAVHDRHFWR